jgi:hypothetical protein
VEVSVVQGEKATCSLYEWKKNSIIIQREAITQPTLATTVKIMNGELRIVRTSEDEDVHEVCVVSGTFKINTKETNAFRTTNSTQPDLKKMTGR